MTNVSIVRIGGAFPFGGALAFMGVSAFLATDVVDPIAAVNNYLLPLWMIIFGVRSYPAPPLSRRLCRSRFPDSLTPAPCPIIQLAARALRC